jgi:hypothetical protein
MQTPHSKSFVKGRDFSLAAKSNRIKGALALREASVISSKQSQFSTKPYGITVNSSIA